MNLTMFCFVCVLIVLQVLQLHVQEVNAHRFLDPSAYPKFNTAEIVDFDEYYYYKSATAKMAESLSVSNCTLDGIQKWKGYNPISGHTADVHFQTVAPNKKIYMQWRELHFSLQESREKHATRRQFIQISPSLCTSKEFRFYSDGHFRRAKGCFQMILTDPKTGKRLPKRVNTYGATLHPDHSRCNHQAAVQACKTATLRATDYPVDILDSTPIANEAYPFIISAKDVIVAKSGMFAFPCGPFGLYSSCEATNWGLPSARKHINDVIACRAADEGMQGTGGHMTEHDHTMTAIYGKHALHLEGCDHPVHEKIFVISQYDDTQIGQFVLETLPKLIMHLDFIMANPDMKIHFGFTKQKKTPAYVLPHNIFQWLGLANRLINGTWYVLLRSTLLCSALSRPLLLRGMSCHVIESTKHPYPFS